MNHNKPPAWRDATNQMHGASATWVYPEFLWCTAGSAVELHFSSSTEWGPGLTSWYNTFQTQRSLDLDSLLPYYLSKGYSWILPGVPWVIIYSLQDRLQRRSLFYFDSLCTSTDTRYGLICPHTPFEVSRYSMCPPSLADKTQTCGTLTAFSKGPKNPGRRSGESHMAVESLVWAARSGIIA